MEQPDSLRPWRDTLADLGVIGLVPEPAPAVPMVEAVPAVAAAPAPARPAPARRPVDVPAPLPAVAAFVVPQDPKGNPTEALVAGCSTLKDLEAATCDCKACPLGAGRLRYVFGEGNPAASMMFIGEGPGRDEDLQGRPFVGAAGALLDKMIKAIGLSREQVYIANVVKCRPPDNRTPTPEEAGRCLRYLRRQIELVRPSVIVTLGATPLRELVGVGQGITKVRGQWQRLEMAGGIPVMPTFHPAYVLRQYTDEVRRHVWQDLLAAKSVLDQDAPKA